MRHHTRARWGAPLSIVVGLAALAVGVLLIVAALPVQTIAVITGVGIALLGIAALVVPVDVEAPADSGPDSGPGSASASGSGDPGAAEAPRATRRTLLRGAVAAASVAIGAVIALWPDAGAPWLAFLVGAGLIVHGVTSAVRAIRGSADQRVAALIGAAATIIVGVVTFSWPVLTLVVFRLSVGAWFVFFGLQLLVTTLVRWRRHRAALRHGDGTASTGAPTDRASADHTPADRAPHRGRLARWARTAGAAVSLVLAVLLAYGSGSILGGVPLPAPGAFYTAPAEVPDSPGQLIRSEPLTTGVPAGARAWKILYTTTHPDGSPAISSGTVIAPSEGAAGSAPLPLLTVAHGTTGVEPKCAPSMSATPFADGAGTALADMVTKHGWVAVISDYIGLGTAGPHPYLIGDAEARNVLDASRAVQRFDEISTTTDTVVWGHSQGGQGALWTGQVAESYAPELSVLGIAAFAPAADLYGLAEADKNDAPGKTVSAYIASTWNDIFPELELESQLTPGSAGGVERIEQLCFNGKDALSAILTGTQIPNQVFPDEVLDGPFGTTLKAQTPTGPFPAPVMVAQGLADPLVKPQLQHDWVEARCEAGVPIDYRTFPGLSHNTLVDADSPLTPEIVSWTLDRWNGSAPTPNCTDLPK
ncbi:alpha/beta hydrolase [Leucobacter rhizosphaerae]|uniref:Alpha/beta hydrolase n=1 Tax=Leucobacter rhizosphaerae TaxID=2932245 RepID=A0ABY4FVF5_9MICO|nr:lipase family protein [Leucobacter rhizosphaerae]UOQ60290.1 alpha/beta hydrolase [Leucobacter rhizosphaerae]